MVVLKKYPWKSSWPWKVYIWVQIILENLSLVSTYEVVVILKILSTDAAGMFTSLVVVGNVSRRFKFEKLSPKLSHWKVAVEGLEKIILKNSISCYWWSLKPCLYKNIFMALWVDEKLSLKIQVCSSGNPWKIILTKINFISKSRKKYP